jgi:hypothetical protein
VKTFQKEKTRGPGLTFDVKVDLSFDHVPDFNFEGAGQKRTPGEITGAGHALKYTQKVKRRRTYDLSRVPNATRLLAPLPARGECVHAIMGGDFNAWDLVPAMRALLDRPIAELHITTLGFNHSNNGNLCDMLDAGDVGRVWVVCSEYFRDADRDCFAAAETRLRERGQKICAVRNHSKILLFAPEDSAARYVIESSANLRSCNNLEQLVISNDAALYKFHRGWIERLFP